MFHNRVVLMYIYEHTIALNITRHFTSIVKQVCGYKLHYNLYITAKNSLQKRGGGERKMLTSEGWMKVSRTKIPRGK